MWQPAIESPAPRSPEEARRIMSALQAGTARGRATATGTSPERAAAVADDRQGLPVDAPSPTPAERPADPEPMTATERDA